MAMVMVGSTSSVFHCFVSAGCSPVAARASRSLVGAYPPANALNLRSNFNHTDSAEF